jgi:hypothetical protein
MRKRKLSNKIFGENPWDVEVELSPLTSIQLPRGRA